MTRASGTRCRNEVLLIGCSLGRETVEMTDPLLDGLRRLICRLLPTRVAFYLDERHAWPARHSPAWLEESCLSLPPQLPDAAEVKSVITGRAQAPIEDTLAAMFRDAAEYGIDCVSIGILDDGTHRESGTLFMPPLSQAVRKKVLERRLRLVYGGLAASVKQRERILRAAQSLGVQEHHTVIRSYSNNQAERQAAVEDVLANLADALGM